MRYGLGGLYLEGLIHGGAYFQNFTVFHYKVRQLFYYKVREVLIQTDNFTTKCDDYYKVRQNTP